MCVIVTSPGQRRRPSLRNLELCERTNPHGSGVAWLDGRRVAYVKGLSVPEIHELLRATPGPAIVHFRIASVGGVTPQLCHPFPITHKAELRERGRARSVLFHNGTWSDYHRYADHFGITFPRSEPVSDTRVAATLIARFGFEWLKRVNYCRWALLDADGIRRVGKWVRSGGCHYSNSLWMPAPSSGSYDWLKGFQPDEEEEQGGECA